MTMDQTAGPRLTDVCTEEELRSVRSSLMVFNESTAPSGFQVPNERLDLVLKEEDGKLAGGLLGRTYRFAVYIEILWVDEKYRGQGLGARLMKAAEEEAVRRGCRLMHLDTFSFQAPDFYRKLGFEVFGELAGFPDGAVRYFLKKTI
ncbi:MULTISPECIES: GNAT family N-acetyltransferase [Paenibacillus]|uniref:GNAT family N-acetyltransferase n=1 Tax=Paenibacillus TaxID=44249 RepID=UPI0022B88A76|nr:GNAT family N-acetyltransferase [Paenibacillus caseinilyticus]MCZ8520696.1 GNAT family N-acetyltransferase [Paenibacillus caseinilyticus]